MKAIVYSNYGGPEVLKLKDIETPKPKPNEVLVKVEAISLNPVDAKARRGGFRPMSDLLKFPRVTGTDFSGVIIETGKNVSIFTKQGKDILKKYTASSKQKSGG